MRPHRRLRDPLDPSLIAHFRGGPLDGTTRTVPDARPVWLVPRPPVFRWTEADTLPAPSFETYRYERVRGVVAGEIVYEYVPG